MDLEGEACGCGQSEASPSYLSLLQGSLNQGPAAVVSLAWQTASRRKSLSSLCSSPVWAAVHSCAHTQPHPLWPSACDSPVHLGRCCPVGKSRPPPRVPQSSISLGERYRVYAPLWQVWDYKRDLQLVPWPGFSSCPCLKM